MPGNPNSKQVQVVGFKDCAAYLKGDSLILENSLIKRILFFNRGDLTSCTLLNMQSGAYWLSTRAFVQLFMLRNF
jgi:hypothetical protein